MSIAYKKITSHGSISIPVAMRRDIGLQGGDPMEVSQSGGNWSSERRSYGSITIWRGYYYQTIYAKMCVLWNHGRSKEV